MSENKLIGSNIYISPMNNSNLYNPNSTIPNLTLPNRKIISSFFPSVDLS